MALSHLAVLKDQTFGSKPFGTSLMLDFWLEAVCHFLNDRLLALSRLEISKDQTSGFKPFDTFLMPDFWL